VVRGARVLASARGVAIELAAPNSAAFTGDEELVRRLIGNLVDNAIRHAPADRAVHVVLRKAPRGYTISVRDQGPGVPAEIQPFIFDRFCRSDVSRVRQALPDGGAGLGLALARWIASVHGGDVTLTQSSDAGTVFTAELADAS
jgi:signal transduction histidine kinase